MDGTRGETEAPRSSLAFPSHGLGVWGVEATAVRPEERCVAVRAGEPGALLGAGLRAPVVSAGGVPDRAVPAGAPASRRDVGWVARPCHTAQGPHG